MYLRRRSVRRTFVYSGLLLVGFGGYFVARAVHFGHLFPNTSYAKLDYGNRWLAQRGALYVWDFVKASPLLFVLGVAELGSLRRSPLWVKGFLPTVAVLLAVTVYEGADHFAMFRFLVPVVPFLALLALVPFASWQPSSGGGVLRGAAVGVIGLLVLGISDLLVGRSIKRDEFQPSTQFERFVAECAYAREWAAVGQCFRDTAPPDASVATIAIGALGYFSGLTVLDPHGIVNPAVAHLHRELGRGYAGHEKYDVDQVLSRRPGYILLIHVLTPVPVPEQTLSEAAWGEFNRALAGRSELRRDYQYQVLRLGTQYLNYFVRRDLPPLGHAGARAEPAKPS